MTQSARIVLQDAAYAIEHHSDVLQGEAFRVSWFSVIGLLRAVGHVLGKVDASSSSSMRHAVTCKYNELKESRPEPRIYWEFINSERNRFLKNYDHGITRVLTVPTLIEGVYLAVDGANSRGGEFAPGRSYTSAFARGEGAGRNERDIAWRAHDWWSNYLDAIDELARVSTGI
jgi:hypothetical protein